MNVKEFKIHLMRGLLRPEYFYIPLLSHGTSGFSIYIDKTTDRDGSYVAGAVFYLQSDGSDIYTDMHNVAVIGANILYIGENGSYIQFESKTQRITISGLNPGKYYIYESRYPPQHTSGSINAPPYFTIREDGSCIYTYGTYVIPDNIFPVVNNYYISPANITFVLAPLPDNFSATSTYERIEYDAVWETSINDSVTKSADILGTGRVTVGSSQNAFFRTDFFKRRHSNQAASYYGGMCVKIYYKGVYKGYFTFLRAWGAMYELSASYVDATYNGHYDGNTLYMLDMLFGPEAEDTERAMRYNDYYPRQVWREDGPAYYENLSGGKFVPALYADYHSIEHEEVPSAIDGNIAVQVGYGVEGFLPIELLNDDRTIVYRVNDKDYTVTYDDYSDFRRYDGTRMRVRCRTTGLTTYTTIASASVESYRANGWKYLSGATYPEEQNVSSGYSYITVWDSSVNKPISETYPEKDECTIEVTGSQTAMPSATMYRNGEAVDQCIYYGGGLTKTLCSEYLTMFHNGRGSSGERIVCAVESQT